MLQQERSARIIVSPKLMALFFCFNLLLVVLITSSSHAGGQTYANSEALCVGDYQLVSEIVSEGKC
ncbi:hypothetical protein OAN83_02915 [Alphaproteobacteria bacterium]|nr:hypothetical protein [Alphaproteobacteria bacterium]